jgi:acetyl-CoA carboxylase biotin carboxyl carrier protein
MDVEEIRSILDLMQEHDLSEFELEVEGLKIRVKKSGGTPVVEAPGLSDRGAVAPGGAAPAAAGPVDTRPQAVSGPEAVGNLAIVTSPIVGTFYQAPEPGAPPFVQPGSRVTRGQVLCIIEAMKLMNEIESEYAGDVAAVYVENGQPVQFGERLFAIRVS